MQRKLLWKSEENCYFDINKPMKSTSNVLICDYEYIKHKGNINKKVKKRKSYFIS